MPLSTKAIKRRIKSVKSTRKITKAMEMVAASKMRKAVEAALNTRTYAEMAWELLVHLSKSGKAELPLLRVESVKKLLVVLVTSNRGLCGSFNSNIIKKTAAQLEDPKNISRHRISNGSIIEPSENIEVDVIGVGQKGADFAKKMGYNMIASYSDLSDTPGLSDILPISKMVVEAYEEGKYDKVVVAYTDYKSAIAQIAKLRQVLPISEHDLDKMIRNTGPDTPWTLTDPKFDTIKDLKGTRCPTLEAGDLFRVESNKKVFLLNADMERMHFPSEEVFHSYFEDFSGVVDIPLGCVENYPTGGTMKFNPELNKEKESEIELADYIFEPSRQEVLKTILPRLVESQIFQAVLESSASEHSARMMAMRNASDAANDMIDELTLSFNKARQAGITQEIAEIASGSMALE